MTQEAFGKLKPGSAIYIAYPNRQQDVVEQYLMKINRKHQAKDGLWDVWKARGDFIYFQEDEDDPYRFGWDIYRDKDIVLEGVHVESATTTVPDVFKKHLVTNIFEKEK